MTKRLRYDKLFTYNNIKQRRVKIKTNMKNTIEYPDSIDDEIDSGNRQTNLQKKIASFALDDIELFIKENEM